MIDTEIFDLLYTHLEERSFNSVRNHLNSDAKYQEAMVLECELFQKYESLNFSKEQCPIIQQWTDAITARIAAYSAIMFHMEIQCCFSNV